MLSARSRLERACVPSRVWSTVGMACGLLVSHCAESNIHGGQTGDGSGFGPHEPDDAIATFAEDCSTTTTVWSDELDASVAAVGYSVQDVLNAVAPGINDSLLWAPDSGVEIQPETGTGRISIGFEYAGGEIRVTQPQSGAMATEATGSTDAGTDAKCLATLAIDVQLQVSTSGGALNEHMAATLVARPGVIAFSASMPIADMAGSLRLVPAGGWHEIRVSGVVSDAGSTGYVAARAPSDPAAPSSALERPAETAARAEVMLAAWPASLE